VHILDNQRRSPVTPVHQGPSRRFAARLLLTAALMIPASAARADVVLTWNEIAVRTMVQQGQNPFLQARTASIVQLAVFEAVNAINGEFEPYLGLGAAAGASAEAAAATAAYDVLKAFFPAATDLDARYAATLSTIPDGESKTAGVSAGHQAATQILLHRANDGAAGPQISPVGLPVPGVWQVTVPGCAAGASGGVFYHWRNVVPFGVPEVARFRPEPPPDVTSTAFAKAFEEVKRVGDVISPYRPDDRSDVARFYHATSPTQVVSQAARQVAAAGGLTLSENARLLALANMAVNDSLIASMSAKYHYNYWRPVTAIRFPGTYGRHGIEADPGFTPLIGTPCFPSYPSNHASATRSGAEVLRRAFGAGGHDLVIDNPYVAPVSHLHYRYSAFDDFCADVDDARIFGGVHYRFDQVAGNQLGRDIGTYVYKHNLRRRGGGD
jgi:hypothetical protein